MARRTLLSFVAAPEDPRVERTRKHRLDDILVIALCAMLSGASSFEEIELFAELREDWLRMFLTLPGGLPSHDTIFASFVRWIAKCLRSALPSGSRT